MRDLRDDELAFVYGAGGAGRRKKKAKRPASGGSRSGASRSGASRS